MIQEQVQEHIKEQALISAEELFGAASELATQVTDATTSDIDSLGSFYQIATGVVALLFIFILVRYYKLFSVLLLSFVSKSGQNSDLHSFSAEIHNIQIFTSIAGLSLLSLFVMRLTITNEFSQIFSTLGIGAWGIGGIVFGATLLLIFLERGILFLVGGICEQGKACDSIWRIKQLHFSTTIILLTPLLILALLTEGSTTRIALYCSVAVCFVSSILFIKDTFLFFRAQRFSIFHWILYLCALEIFPLSLLIAPIARGGF